VDGSRQGERSPAAACKPSVPPSPPPPRQSESAGLPAGWAVSKDVNGTPYYYNATTRQSQYEHPGPGDGYAIAAELSLQTTGTVSMKARGVINSLGEIIAHEMSFNPEVNVYQKPSDEQVNGYIQIVCPGVLGDDCEVQDVGNGVRVRLEKHKLIDELLVVPMAEWPIRQNHGVWEKTISFDSSDGWFELDEDSIKLEDGMLTMMLKPKKKKIIALKPKKKDIQPPPPPPGGLPAASGEEES